MPHMELIFLHSENADGCNARRVPPPGSFIRKTRQSSDRLHKQIPDRRRAIEDEVQEAFAICGGDVIAALRITLIADAISGS